MATKKIVVKKAVAGVKKVKQAPVTEVFQVQPQVVETVSVPRSKVQVLVNGQDKGMVEHGGGKLGEFVVQQAQRFGVRTFSVYADGRKVDTSASGKSLREVGRIEIVAKDSRG